MNTRAWLMGLMGGLAMAVMNVGHAATDVPVGGVRLDDTGTYVDGGHISMRWEAAAPLPGREHTMVGEGVVHVHLNTQDFVGHHVRISMSLPPQPFSQVLVQWQGRGILRDGLLRDGDRVVVFDGIVTTPFLEDTLLMTLRVDGRRLEGTELLSFSFDAQPL